MSFDDFLREVKAVSFLALFSVSFLPNSFQRCASRVKIRNILSCNFHQVSTFCQRLFNGCEPFAKIRLAAFTHVTGCRLGSRGTRKYFLKDWVQSPGPTWQPWRYYTNWAGTLRPYCNPWFCVVVTIIWKSTEQRSISLFSSTSGLQVCNGFLRKSFALGYVAFLIKKPTFNILFTSKRYRHNVGFH